MNNKYLLAYAVFVITGINNLHAQCNGIKGPNLLGAKGTFSAPFITVNNAAAGCTGVNTASYNPAGNIGNALNGCSTIGSSMPCSDYTYTAASGGLSPEARYTIINVIGNGSGGNCIKPEWRGTDHTGDGGYFMAVNGAPNTTTSPIFYKIKTIPVCIGATYEFSAWVINLLPAGHAAALAGSEPNISFRVNGTVIGNSGPITYTAAPTWVKVNGTFTATTSTVDLEVVNATAVASGNDLGLDDISINVCGSQVAGTGPQPVLANSTAQLTFTVTDPTQTHSWFKWQQSIDGGATFTDIGSSAQFVFTGPVHTLFYNTGMVTEAMNGKKIRLVVAPSMAGLADPECIYYNDFTLIVPNGGPLPVSLIGFNGKSTNGSSLLDWQTSQEWNSNFFEIQRSYNGRDFVAVGTVAAAGNSNRRLSYQFTDRTSGSGYVYYRLQQVDKDGKSAQSTIVRLNMGTENAAFDLYPNPFVNHLNASFSATKTANATLVIRNINGQILFKKTIAVTKGSNSVQLSNLPVLGRGLYHVSVQNEDINYQGKVQKL